MQHPIVCKSTDQLTESPTHGWGLLSERHGDRRAYVGCKTHMPNWLTGCFVQGWGYLSICCWRRC